MTFQEFIYKLFKSTVFLHTLQVPLAEEARDTKSKTLADVLNS